MSEREDFGLGDHLHDRECPECSSFSESGDDEPRWLSAPEQRAWRALLRGTSALMSALDADLQPHGVSLSEYEILAMVSEQPRRSIRMSALADLVSQSRSRLTHAANRLERRGWVTRQRSERDGRGVLLSLTTEGITAVEQLAPVHLDSVRRRVVDLMSAEEFTTLGALMRVIAEGSRTDSREMGIP